VRLPVRLITWGEGQRTLVTVTAGIRVKGGIESICESRAYSQ
jgi:hypothetical protein